MNLFLYTLIVTIKYDPLVVHIGKYMVIDSLSDVQWMM